MASQADPIVVWPELVLPTEAESLARAWAHITEFERVLSKMRADRVDLTKVADTNMHPSQWLYQQDVYLAWLAHHLAAGTAHSNFWLPYAWRSIEQPAFVLCHYSERDPQAYGVDWWERLVLYLVNAADVQQPGDQLQRLGDRVHGVCPALVEDGVITFIGNDGEHRQIPFPTELTDHRPEQGGQTTTHRHPDPHIYAYLGDHDLPFWLTIEPNV
ncbi:MAG: hypothetical protein Q7S64_01960 [bacterium]|nr:hypothetical protein [bacterium]